MEAIEAFAGRVPVLGVCLGHQCIGQAVRRATIVRAPGATPRQDLARSTTRGRACSPGLPNPFAATRYHSLVVDAATCPPELEVTAWTDDGLIMGLRHRTLPIEGVQFHPESMLTKQRQAPARQLPRPGGALCFSGGSVGRFLSRQKYERISEGFLA